MLTFFTPNGERFIESTAPEKEKVLVVTSHSLTHEDANLLVERFDLDEHALSNVFDENELPHVETIGKTQYIFLRNFSFTGGKSRSNPILFIVKDSFFACISAAAISTSDVVDVGILGKTPELLQRSVMSIITKYEQSIDAIGAIIQSVERRMWSHEATNQDFFEFVSIEGALSRARVGLSGIISVVEKLIDTPRTKTSASDLVDNVLYARELVVEIDSHVQTIKSIREAYSTVANNTLNSRMKLLTVLTLFLAIPNVFFGMYGMNINLPFMHEVWAYPVVLGGSIIAIFLVYFIARARKIF